jgi:CRISPR/Cas system CSM-associated protein Csm3 (group 7 of RAMP superfamily)
MKANFKIQFLSFWHCGSGVSGGAETDALIVRDPEGLPYVPGKTLKGHLREASEWLVENDSEHFAELHRRIFGTAPDSKFEQLINSQISNESLAGKAHFSDCYLHPDYFNEDAVQLPNIFSKRIYSTAIEENGIAKNSSLRSMEVAVPLSLYGRIADLNGEELAYLETCMGLVKELGAGKTRGLGKCKLEFITNL